MLPVCCGKQLYQRVCSQHGRLNAGGKLAFAEALRSETEITMSSNAVAESSCCTTSLARLTGDLYASVSCKCGFGAAFQTLYRDFHPAAPMSQFYDKLSSNACSSWQHMCCV